ncbi:carbon-nitrogen hydrolase family protein [Agromyces larvae]|uniref:Carbon-nitrogen hydrolase family protein n=1 Tax=Agromyces larvae TaxID=2929802 RepID=A0ABY4C3K4_9MICO|nr:carbon-nitrogen hydrolase family protein [Agromyces larvae]UOE45569.1 carbon-nitrogen hydrolase family protein [Agromyces larvae]
MSTAPAADTAAADTAAADTADSAAEPAVAPAVAIAVAQFAPTTDVDANLHEIARLAGLAAARGARVVVFPEYAMCFTPAPGQEMVDAAEPLDGEFVHALADLAGELGVHVVAGVLEQTEDRARFRNTVVALAPDGALVATYRKLHLYDAFGQRESEWVEAGELADPEVFDAHGLRFGLQTCYDVRFPEVSRRIVDAGADVILMPAEWVRGPLKEAHWRTLTTARAIENTVYVAAADHPAPVSAGNSMIVDPMGVEVATVGEGTDIALAWVSRERIDATRRLNPALELRRFGVAPR